MAATKDPDQEIKDYLALVFPPGPGRDAFFLTCTNCHGLEVIILMAPSLDRTAMEGIRNRHDVGFFIHGNRQWEGRQPEHDIIWEYIMEHFGPDKPPPPPMPERLRSGWRTYL